MPASINNSPFKRLTFTTAGTTVISANPCNLDAIMVGTTTTGTVAFYNTNVTTGTTATNLLTTMTGTAGTFRPLGFCNSGLTAVGNGGTIDMLISAG